MPYNATVLHEFKKAGYTIKVFPDDSPSDPRDADNLGKMVCFHRRYNLGDKHEFDSPAEFEEFWAAHDKTGIRVPVYMYDHSGITIRTTPFSCPWDSGQLGYIYATKEDIQREYGELTPAAYEKAREVLCLEVEVYDRFVTGAYCGYEITDPDGEFVDSCWGFDNDDYCFEEAQRVLDGILAPSA